ncbi:unnamed protein product [Effrenium voratum]|nr:unnamed protein product [Effrenium voratum]
MVVLVLGGTGKTGLHLVQQLLARNVKVRTIVRSPEKLPIEVARHSELAVTTAKVLEMSDEALVEQLKDCTAVVSCLGHEGTYQGMCGKASRFLVYDVLRRVCRGIGELQSPAKVILMSTGLYTNPENDEDVKIRNTCGQRALLCMLSTCLPPHNDNMRAAEFLRTELKGMEWCAVRPELLIDGEVSQKISCDLQRGCSVIALPLRRAAERFDFAGIQCMVEAFLELLNPPEEDVPMEELLAKDEEALPPHLITKALYRKASAQRSMRRLDACLATLEDLLQVESGHAAAKQMQQEAEREWQKQCRDQKKNFRKMFDKLSGEDKEAEERERQERQALRSKCAIRWTADDVDSGAFSAGDAPPCDGKDWGLSLSRTVLWSLEQMALEGQNVIPTDLSRATMWFLGVSSTCELRWLRPVELLKRLPTVHCLELELIGFLGEIDPDNSRVPDPKADQLPEGILETEHEGRQALLRATKGSLDDALKQELIPADTPEAREIAGLVGDAAMTFVTLTSMAPLKRWAALCLLPVRAPEAHVAAEAEGIGQCHEMGSGKSCNAGIGEDDAEGPLGEFGASQSFKIMSLKSCFFGYLQLGLKRVTVMWPQMSSGMSGDAQ